MLQGRPANRVGAVTLAVLVSAGSLKAHPTLAWLPVDLTLLAAIVLTVLVLASMLRLGTMPNATWIPIAFVAVTAPAAPMLYGEYGATKSLLFYTLTLLCMLAAVLLLRDRRQRSAFLTTLAVIAVLVTLALTVAPERPSIWSEVVMLPGTNTISTSRMIFTGVIIIGLRALLSNLPALDRALLLALAGCMTLAALNTGSRGPALATAAGAGLALLIILPSGRRGIRSLLFGIAGVAVLGFFAAQSTTGGLDRIVALIQGATDNSTNAREKFWETSIQHIIGHPLGGGWGSFERLVTLKSGAPSAYPHNSVLEITLEAGWLAGLAFVVLVIAALARYMRLSNHRQTVILLALFVFAVVNSMVSGDVNDNRLMWTLLFLPFVLKVDEAPGFSASMPVARLGKKAKSSKWRWRRHSGTLGPFTTALARSAAD